jgi:hypothetical protein
MLCLNYSKKKASKSNNFLVALAKRGAVYGLAAPQNSNRFFFVSLTDFYPRGERWHKNFYAGVWLRHKNLLDPPTRAI